MFTTFHMGHYQPLSWVTFGLDYLLWGTKPFGYHLTNLFLHAANAVLFYYLTVRFLTLTITGPPPSGELSLRVAAAFSSFVFAIHPLRVESVAWVTERRDVLSGLFLLWAVLCYLRAVTLGGSEPQRLPWTIATAIAYGLSLLSKASGITFPIVLLVLDIYPLGRLGGGFGRWFGTDVRGVWLEKVPFFVLAVSFGMIGLLAQQEAGALRDLRDYNLTFRLVQALFGIAFYLWKTVIPLWLSPLYELSSDPKLQDWPFALGGFVTLAVSIGLFIFRRCWTAGLAIWVCYVILLAPVLGIAQSGPQLVADRYSYLSCLGWATLVGAGLLYQWRFWVSGQISRGIFVPVVGLAAAVLIGLGVLTWQQAQVWHDSERLWRHVLGVAERSHFKSSRAHYNLGNIAATRGNLEDAIKHYHQALQINPAHADVHYNLGEILAHRGELEGAIKHYRRALHLNPADAGAHIRLAEVLVQRGALKGAIEHFAEALRLSPERVEAHFYLGTSLFELGDIKQATDHFQQAVKIKPDFAEAHHNLGRLMAAQDNLAQAIDHFQKALLIQPDFAEAHESLGRALVQLGKREEAVEHYQKALQIMKSRGG